VLGVTLLLSFGSLVCCVLFGNMRRSVLAGAFGRNSAVGLRTRSTKSSDEAWERGHCAAAPWMLATVVTVGLPALAAAALAISAVALDGETSRVTGVGGITFAAVSYLNLLTFGCISVVVADRAAKAEPAAEA